MASNYVLEKSGFKREGIFRKAVWNAAEDGLMATDTAFSAKNGKNPRF